MTVWRTYNAILDACCSAWNSLMNDAERIASIQPGPGHRSKLEPVGIIRHLTGEAAHGCDDRNAERTAPQQVE